MSDLPKVKQNNTQITTYAKELISVITFTCIVCVFLGCATVYIFPEMINEQFFVPNPMKSIFYNVVLLWVGVLLGVVGMVDKLVRVDRS